jgi:hypothetical protein
MQIRDAFLALVATSPFAAATTWIVDVNNGPGTDFTQISSAIVAVSAGDTLLVRTGSYATFVLDKQLAIVAVGAVSFPHATVQNLPAGSTTVLADLYAFDGFEALDNAGALMLDGISCGNQPVAITNSADVRFRRLNASYGMTCSSSRVEIADSTIVGHDGQPCMCCIYPHTGGPGQIALSVSGGEVHVARSTAIGGQGGAASCVEIGGCDTDGGNGGAGIALTSSARLVLSGTVDEFLQGGAGGSSSCIGGSHGVAGAALSIGASSEARVSGESLIGGIANLGGTLASPSPDDPTLVALDAPSAGNNFTLRVRGPAGATCDIVLGRRPIIVGTPALDEEELTPVNRVFHLGVIPANGTVSLNYPISPSWSPGFSVVFQGRLVVSGSTVYTNSLPAIVR